MGGAIAQELGSGEPRSMKVTRDSLAWEHFNEAFRHFNRGWQAADRAFDSMVEGKPPTGHEHTIAASTWENRWRIFFLFQKLAWKLLWRGRVRIRL